MSLGFQQAGFKVICAIDNNRSAIETYRKNLGEHAVVADLGHSTDLPKATVVVGAPPCQGFSSAGLRRDGDARNTLTSQFASVVATLRPAAFVFENVEGFLTGEDGNRVLDLLLPLIDAGYRIHLRKVNAANYGVPQHRKRVVAIGGLGWEPSFPSPTHGAFGAPGAHLAARHLPPAPTLEEGLASFIHERPGRLASGHRRIDRGLGPTSMPRIPEAPPPPAGSDFRRASSATPAFTDTPGPSAWLCQLGLGPV
jgi:DNA (cytosine-5)-methyltransferase 1